MFRLRPVPHNLERKRKMTYEELKNGAKASRVSIKLDYYLLEPLQRELFYIFTDFLLSTGEVHGLFDLNKLAKRVNCPNINRLRHEIREICTIPFEVREEYDIDDEDGGIAYSVVNHGNFCNCNIIEQEFTDLETGKIIRYKYVIFTTYTTIVPIIDELKKHIEETDKTFEYTHIQTPYEDVCFK